MSASLPRHHSAWHELHAEMTAQCHEPLLDTHLHGAEARRHEPKAGAYLGEQRTQALRLRTAEEQSQRFETRTLKRKPTAQARELAQHRNATPGRQ